MKFQTTSQVRQFLAGQGIEFKGIYQAYTLTDGRVVQFISRSRRNCWGISTEATEMVGA